MTIVAHGDDHQILAEDIFYFPQEKAFESDHGGGPQDCISGEIERTNSQKAYNHENREQLT